MQRIFLFVLVLSVGGCSPQPQLRIDTNRILYQSSDIKNSLAKDSIKSVRPALLGFGNLIARYPDGQNEKISKKDLWGYSDNKGRVYRYYRNTYYEVVRVENVVYYKQERVHPRTRPTHTFYSKTLDSKLFRSRKKALGDLATL